jgi:hypothetical protein
MGKIMNKEKSKLQLLYWILKEKFYYSNINIWSFIINIPKPIKTLNLRNECVGKSTIHYPDIFVHILMPEMLDHWLSKLISMAIHYKMPLQVVGEY